MKKPKKKYVVLRHLSGPHIGMKFWSVNSDNNTHSKKGELWYEEIAFTNDTNEAIRLSNNF